MLKAFAKLDQSAWNTPFSLAWLIAAFYKRYLALADYDCADAYDWLVRVQPFHAGNASIGSMLLVS